MGVQIISGATSDLLTVDPTSKAARTTLYDAYGNPMSDVKSVANVLNALNAAVTISLGGQTTAGFTVTGTSGTLTLSFEASIDGTTWFALSATPVAGGAAVSSTAADGSWVAALGGYQGVRARVSAFTSGSMTVSVVVTPGDTKTVTQTVTASTLPLPTGASTSANQTTLGSQTTKINDGTNTAAVSAANALKVDGSAVTQPVSAASLPLPTGASTSANQTTLGSQTTKINDGTNTAAVSAANALKVDGSAVTQPVSAASLPLPTGAATSANQTTLGNQTTKINDGTNTAAVKAASTPAATTDTALVVALSPNNTPFAFGGDDRLRVGQETLIFYDNIEGATIDLNRWTQSQSGMTQAQTSANLTLNSGSSTTTGNYSILTSAKQALVSVEFPIYVQFRARIVSQNNAVEELGFGFAATTSAPTDGVFFRVDAAGAVKGVINFGGTETLTSAFAALTSSTFYNFEVTIFEDHCQFEISSADLTYNASVSLAIPAGQGSPTSAGHLPVYARVYNSGTPGTAAQIIVASVSAQQMDLATNKTWGEQMASINRSAIYDPSTFAQTTNYTNSTVPAAATLSNTAAGYTTLGGLFRFATVAGAETDYALFAYQVPTGSLLYIYSISIHAFVTGAASAGTTPILLQWALAANSSAVSLATGAPNPPFFLPIGMQQVQRSASIGDAFIPGELLYIPTTPIIVNPSRFLHVVVRIPIAAALATQFIRGTVTIEGVFE